MNKQSSVYLILLLTVTCLNAQKDALSEQELTVIKNYQFDIENIDPISLETTYELPVISFEKNELTLDLLPVKMDEVTFEIKPIAHKIAPTTQKKGHFLAHYGSMNNRLFKGSYRHQVPNYFLYGIDGSYSHLDDTDVLNKNIEEVKGSGFLRYYLKPSFWIQYGLNYQRESMGKFGFHENIAFIPSEATEANSYRTISHEVDLYKSLNKQNMSFQLNTELLATSGMSMRDKEHVLSSNLSVSKKFNEKWQMNLSSRYQGQVSTINSSETGLLWENNLGFIFQNKAIGIRAEGLTASTQDRKIQLYPNGEIFLRNKSNKLSLFHKTSFEFNSFYATQDEIFQQNRREHEVSSTEQKKLGLSYEYTRPQMLGFSLSAQVIDLKDDLIWVNDINDIQLFVSENFDYTYYNVGLKYNINFNKALSFTQQSDLNILKGMSASMLPHFQKFIINSELNFDWKKWTIEASYDFGDVVLYSRSVQEYGQQSDYLHNINIHMNYNLSEALTISIVGLDLLDNRFERYAGYRNFGRRALLRIQTIF